MEIVVPDEKLSLAIGRKGQNVRLASQLTDWKLDVISESKFKQDGGGGGRGAAADRDGERRRLPRRCTAWASARLKRSPRRGWTSSPRDPRNRPIGAFAEQVKVDSAFSTMERLRYERLQCHIAGARRAAHRARAPAVRRGAWGAHAHPARGRRLQDAGRGCERGRGPARDQAAGIGLKKAAVDQARRGASSPRDEQRALRPETRERFERVECSRRRPNGASLRPRPQLLTEPSAEVRRRAEDGPLALGGHGRKGRRRQA